MSVRQPLMRDIEYAGLGARARALLLDGLIVAVPSLVFALGVGGLVLGRLLPVPRNTRALRLSGRRGVVGHARGARDPVLLGVHGQEGADPREADAGHSRGLR